MLPMHATLRRVTDHSHTHKARLITILPTTPVNTQPLLRGWQLNPDRVPPAIRQEDNSTMNLLDVDIWMWVQVIAPKVAAPAFKQVIWKLFQQLLQSRALMPRRHRTELSGMVWIGPDCPGPLEHPSFCPTDLPRGICDMCQGLAYVILFISSFWS